jgi:NAD(P)H dehydrogenase (quinone)
MFCMYESAARPKVFLFRRRGESMKILVVFHSIYGHVLELAKAVAEGAASVSGTESFLRKVEEFDSVNRWIDGNKRASEVREE